MIAEKTGWTADQISVVNLDALRILIASWARLAKGEHAAQPASESDVKQLQAMLKGIA